MSLIHHAPPTGLRRATLLAVLVLAMTACGVDEPPRLELKSSAESPDVKAGSDAGTGTDAMPVRDDGSASTTTADADQAKQVVVGTIVVTPRSLTEDVVLTGELRAAESVVIRAETSGRTLSIHFAEGHAIRRGQMMVKINDAELVAERKRAALHRDLAAQREKRLGALIAEGTISQDLYDEAKNEFSVLEAELELFDARIAETEVRAPFDGIVGLRAISVGSYLTPQTAITTLQALDPIKIDISAAERYAGRFSRGDRVSFTVAGIERRFEARVFAIEPRIDAETRTILVRAEAPNPDRSLLPGAFAKVNLILDTQDDALMVPSIALVPGVDSTTVFVVAGGRAETRQVTTGRRTQAEVEILDGL